MGRLAFVILSGSLATDKKTMARKVEPESAKRRAHTPEPVVLDKMEKLAQLIRAKRLQVGIRQQELADQLGISRISLHKVEAAHPGVAWGIVATIVHGLGLPLDPDSLPEDELRALLQIESERERVR